MTPNRKGNTKKELASGKEEKMPKKKAGYGKTKAKRRCVQGRVRTKLHEFKKGKLKSSSGKRVTSRKQAIAIGISVGRQECGVQTVRRV